MQGNWSAEPQDGSVSHTQKVMSRQRGMICRKQRIVRK